MTKTLSTFFIILIKQQIKSPEQLEALKAEAASFEKKEEIKALAEQVTWGPPVYADRAVSNSL